MSSPRSGRRSSSERLWAAATAARTIFVLALLLIFATPAGAQEGPPVDLEDALVLAPAPLRVQAALLDRRCVTFRLDDSARSKLRAAGATDAYLDLLRNGCDVEYRAAQTANTPAAYAAYLAKNPDGRFAAQARAERGARLEEELFRAARGEQRGPVYQYYAYQRYLRTHPNGRFAADARAAMERILH